MRGWSKIAAMLGLVWLLAGLMGAAAHAETRIALVITNQSYPDEIGRLTNPHRDGTLIVAALKKVGFEDKNIIAVRDADQPAMRQAVADLIEKVEQAGPDTVVFLYYSGHGAADRTERGENYLIPTGARITLARQLPIQGVSLTEITKALERVRAKARFVVIDACRNVAFTKGLKDAAKGFVPERRLDGIIVAFATRPGETAEDNSSYAAALSEILPTPGLLAEQVFKATQRRVAELSRGTQVPWTEDGLLSEFRFKEALPQPPPAEVQKQAAAAAAPPQPPAPPWAPPAPQERPQPSAEAAPAIPAAPERRASVAVPKVPKTNDAFSQGAAAQAAAPASGGNGFVAVLASQKSRMDALKVFADLQQRYGDVLSNKPADVREVNLGERGVFYRAVVGPPGSREAAAQVCTQLRAAGFSGCWVTAH